MVRNGFFLTIAPPSTFFYCYCKQKKIKHNKRKHLGDQNYLIIYKGHIYDHVTHLEWELVQKSLTILPKFPL